MRDYDLLAGILASQLRLVSRGTLVRYAALLAQQPGLSLLSYLDDSKALSDHDQELLCRIVDSIVHAHKGDEKAALRAFGGDDAASEAFAGSLAHTEQGWGPTEDQTILSRELPHGLPAQITPETIGRYTRGSEYARGGIGRILLVHDEQIGRDVILKELLPEHTTSPTDSTLSRMPEPDSPRSPMRQSAAMMARFLQEAKVTGQLEHPSIVPVYELGTRKDGQLYYTMKLVRGETLSESIKKCRDARDRLGLLRSFLDVCNAMAYAHSKGVIHRDLKPSNIMVGEFGECVVLDWGLAKMQKDVDAHREALEKTISQLKLGDEKSAELKTRSKDILGTPLYMAPEQARGEVDAVGVQSDVYSLGVILFEILTGELPHPWTNSIDTIRRVGTLPAPPIRKNAPHTPPELAAICDKALAFHGKNRYASARELAADIQSFLEGAVVGAYAYKFTDLLGRLYRKHRPIILTSTAAAALLLILGVASYIQIYRARDAEAAARLVAQDQRDEAQRQRETAEEQRSRAEAAEEHTAREKYISDIRLADAYIRDFKFQAAEDTLLATEPRYRNIEWEHLMGQCHQDLATLDEHDGALFSVLSHDSTRVLTLSEDHSAKLWDARGNHAIFTWSLPDSLITNGQFSPSDDRVAIWMEDGTIVVFDAISGAEVKIWRAHNGRVHSAAFSASGDRLVSSGDDRSIRIWDTETFLQLIEIADLSEPPDRVLFTSEDTRILSDHGEGPVRLFDSQSGNFVLSSKTSGRIAGVGGEYVALINKDDVLLVTEDDLKESLRFTHPSPVSSAIYYPQHGEVLSASTDGLLRVWNAIDGRLLRTYNFREPLYTCSLNASGALVIGVSTRGRIRVFDKLTGDEIVHWAGHRNSVTNAAVDARDDVLLTGSFDGTVKEWALGPADIQLSVGKDLESFHLTSTDSGGNWASLGAFDGRIKVISLDDGATVYQARVPSFGGGSRLAISDDGRRLAIVLDDFLPAVLSLSDGNVQALFKGHRGNVNSIRFNPAGTEVITSSSDQTARVWEATTGSMLGELVGHAGIVTDAKYSGNGQLLATISNDCSARVWDRATNVLLFAVEHEESITACNFSPNDSLFAVGSQDGTVQVWDVTQRRKLNITSGQVDDIACVNFSSDSQRLVSSTGAGKFAIWDLTSGMLLVTLPVDNAIKSLWGEYVTNSGTFLTGFKGGYITQNVRIGNGEDLQAQTRKDFLPLVRDFKTRRAAAATAKQSENPANNTLHLYASSSSRSELISSLQGDFSRLSPTPQRWTLNPNAIDRSPVEFLSGDEIVAIAGLAPVAFFEADNMARWQEDAVGKAEFTIDVIRQGAAIRFVLHCSPVQQREETVILSSEQARALLRSSLALFRSHISRIREINEATAPQPLTWEGVGKTNGLNVPHLADAEGKALLKTAGLEAGMRIVAINNETSPVLSELDSLMEAGLAHLENNTVFSLQLEAIRGEFETVLLTIRSTK